jgi:hypothetical protein
MKQDVAPERIRPTPVRPLDGSERFSGAEATVMDFWRWALSDLRMNIVRPMVAEFLVAKAVGDKRAVREAWANFDVLSGEGIRIEVKSSGYCQSWTQKELSRINFGRLAARSWDAETGELSSEPQVRSDVFVFAVQSCKDCSRFASLGMTDAFFRSSWACRRTGGRTRAT